MELSNWVSEHMTILVGIPLLLLALLLPLLFATRGQRAAVSIRSKSTGRSYSKTSTASHPKLTSDLHSIPPLFACRNHAELI